MLTNRFGFKEENITVLLDDSSDPNLWPTGNNMRYHMRELVNGAQSGDSLLFHFSGQPSLLSAMSPAWGTCCTMESVHLPQTAVVCWLASSALHWARALNTALSHPAE